MVYTYERFASADFCSIPHEIRRYCTKYKLAEYAINEIIWNVKRVSYTSMDKINARSFDVFTFTY